MVVGEIFLTVRLVLVALTCSFAVGIPVTLFFLDRFRTKLPVTQLWSVAPLVGIGVIILVSQNLLYLDVRLPYSAMALWGCSLVAWGYIIVTPRLRSLLKPVPWLLLSLGALVYLIHGLGLWYLGASNYYGYGWVDMYNYVSQAQFFMDHPFSSTVADHEFLRTAHFYKHDRIGQSVLHAFIASSSGADAQQAFGITILLSPFLIFFSLFLLVSKLGMKGIVVYLAAMGGALSTAVANVHLECFFSQALAMPFLLLLPLGVFGVINRPRWSSAIAFAILFAVIMSVYTEIVVPCLAVMFVGIVGSFIIGINVGSQKTLKINVIKFGCLALALALLANPGFFKGIISIVQRTNTSGVLACIYPWAFKSEGLARLWLGNQQALPDGWITKGIVIISISLVFLSIGWLIYQIIKGRSIVAFLSSIIMCFPFLVLIVGVVTGNEFPYQFYKLLLMVWPLVIACGLCGMFKLITEFVPGHIPIHLILCIVMVNVFLTGRVAYASSKTKTVAQSGRGGAHLLIDENFCHMREYLDGITDKQIYIWWHDNALYSGNWRGRWLAYHARKNVVWSMIPTPSTGIGIGYPEEFLRPQESKVPSIGISWRDVPNTNKNRVGSPLDDKTTYWVYQLTDSQEIHRIDQASKIIDRTMQLNMSQPVDPEVWYPLWVAGQEGSATLITINFNKTSTRIRYDQWGHPASEKEFDGVCPTAGLLIGIRLDLPKSKMIISCNHRETQFDMVKVQPSLSLKDPLGINNVTGLLEGKYALAKFFPGKIIERPSSL